MSAVGLITDGKTKVSFVTTLASESAPSAATLTAGTSLEHFITADGLIGFEPDTADVDNSALDSTFDTKVAGRASFSNTALRLKKVTNGADTVYDLFVRDLSGYIVIRRGIVATTAWASTQRAEVYPVITGETKNLPPESNTVQKYEVPFKISDVPTIRAVVGA